LLNFLVHNYCFRIVTVSEKYFLSLPVRIHSRKKINWKEKNKGKNKSEQKFIPFEWNKTCQ
jgi:hypothetical protein